MSPQPGLALLHLERGDTEAATASIRSAVEETAPESLRRARLLQAQVEIAGAARDARTACAAAGELARIAEAHASTALKASAESALGVASLAEGKPSAALGRLRHACRLWLEVDAPYDAARVRIHVATALRALDDEGSAVLELEAARAAFERLGARPDASSRSTGACGTAAPGARLTRWRDVAQKHHRRPETNKGRMLQPLEMSGAPGRI